MIYYTFLAFVDIGFYLSENWQGLTATTVATAIGIIVGKRIGSRLAFNYALRVLGISHKSQLEKQIEWLIEQERGRGNIWIAVTSKRLKLNIRPAFFKLSRMPSMKRYIVPFAVLHTFLRRNQTMSKFKSRKFILAVGTGLLIVLNEGLDLGISNESVMYFVGIIATWIVGESAIDMKRAQNGDSGPAE